MQTRAHWSQGRTLLLTTVLIARFAHAQIDASGPWALEVLIQPPTFVFPCAATFTQTGTQLSATTDFCLVIPPAMSGTIDPSSGAFSMRGIETLFCGADAVLAGIVAPDGSMLSATVECTNPTFPGAVAVDGSRCGNGVLESGEVCDDGNRSDGDCCRRDCTPAPAGTDCSFGNVCEASTCDGTGSCSFIPAEGECDDWSSCTTNDTCVAGQCVGTMLPDGTSCDDDDICTTGDVCDGGYCYGPDPRECGACEQCDYGEGCVVQRSYSCDFFSSGRSSLRMRDAVQNDKDVLRWQLAPDSGIAIHELGDPRRTTSYDVCVFEDFGFGRLLAGLEIPANGSCDGKSCWKPQRDGYVFTDKSGSRDGVRSLKLAAGAPGKGKLSLKARGAGLDLGPLPAYLPVTVQLQSSDGACWESDYWDARRNDPLGFEARTLGSPSGSFVAE